MALSQRLKEIYTQNFIDTIAFHTVELSHPLFTKTHYLVRDGEDHDWELEDTSLVTFKAFGFDVNPPTKGGDSQDMMFTFDAVGGLGISEIELAAEDMTSPIVLKYRIYTDDELTQQSDAIILELKDITATDALITTTASRVNLFQRKVPKVKYDSWRFKGVS